MFWFETVHPETGEALEVAAVYFPARRGLRDAYGAPLEPDDEEAVVVCEVFNRAGKPVEWRGLEDSLIVEAWRHIDLPRRPNRMANANSRI